ncbi:MAG: CBS domain-containing protein [Candidatus Levybacteria bacterium]|nr:CBS domain-containing protein [Candidatus Levybacteria bacterium]
MLYLSQLLNKTIYYQGKPFGKLLDVAILENRPVPPISKLMIKKDNKKLTIAPEIEIINDRIELKTQKVPFLPYDINDFYLNEDLLDKQVIDVDGRRVVRVNDILLENNGKLKVIGIDVGIAGILRRLGLGKLISKKTKTLPWSLIEAFDYQTGAVKISLTESRLNNFHPSELADIIEEVGTKERLGIFDVLDAQKAAATIEETDTQTQASIIENLSPSHLKEIVRKMLVSKIADVFYKVNPLRIREILTSVDSEKAQKIQRLSVFPDNVAGRLMEELGSYQFNGEKTVKEVLSIIIKEGIKQEAIIVTNGNERVSGIVYLKDLLGLDPLAKLKDVISERKFVYPEQDFSHILRIFAHYNLHILPVVDKEKHLLGTITIDTILAKIEEQREQNDLL